MYGPLKTLAERIFQIPGDPSPPPGDEGTTEVFRAAPNYLRYRLFWWGVRTVGLVIGLIVGGVAWRINGFRELDPELHLFVYAAEVFIVFGVLVASFVDYVIVKLDYEKRWYLVTDRSLRIREGVAFVKEMTITFANIQNMSVTQGPIQRLLGISDLKVDTAGGAGAAHAEHHGHGTGFSMHTAFFRGVNNAQEIRELMQKRLKGLTDAGLGDHDDVSTSASDGSRPTELGADLGGILREIRSEAELLRMTAERTF